MRCLYKVNSTSGCAFVSLYMIHLRRLVPDERGLCMGYLLLLDQAWVHQLIKEKFAFHDPISLSNLIKGNIY